MDPTTPTTVPRYGVRFYCPRQQDLYLYYVGVFDDVLITTRRQEDVSTWPTVAAAYDAAKSIKLSLWPEGSEGVSVFSVEEPAYDA